MRKGFARLAVVAAVLALSLPQRASTAPGDQQAKNETSPFLAREEMVPMRDGIRLQTLILIPKDQKGPLPILFSRRPYGPQVPSTMPPGWAALARDGYIFVQQWMRGRFKSGGTFTLSTAVHRGQAGKTDEASDAYDLIDWLVKNVPNNNGKVGMWGASYPGFAAGVSLVAPHPALKAVSPQAPWIDFWENDDLHRNGALRLSYATEWLYSLQIDRDKDSVFTYDGFDSYDWFLKLGSAEAVDRKFFKGRVPMFTALLDHPNHDAFYTSQRWSDALGKTTIPTLNVAGYWDQEDPWGSWQVFAKQRQNDPHHLSLMVAGPWSHGLWLRPGVNNVGRIVYGVDSTTQFLEQVQAPFFAYWLHGKGERPDFALKSFQSGSWQWRTYKQWPVPNAKLTSLYLQPDGTLSFSPPPADSGCREYISDPANPVPFRPRPISPTYPGAEWQWWEAEDQRFVDHRPDVLSYISAPLEQDLTVTGKVAATLMASSSGTDSDFVVKLIDVFPDNYENDPRVRGNYTQSLNGYQLPIAMEIRRGRFLESDSTPQPLVPGRVTVWDVPLRDHDHVFKIGHRIMVQVQSSWFPVIDRNPQRFVPNIGRAQPSDYVKATQRVCAGSRVTLPVIRTRAQ